MTLIWQGSNSFLFAALECSRLGFNALLASLRDCNKGIKCVLDYFFNIKCQDLSSTILSK